MTRAIKQVLFRVLGTTSYLKLLHRGFFIYFRTGLLKSNNSYRCHYFVNNFIEKGDTVVDIGANLGYYTGIFSKLVGSSGKVISIEPMRPYFMILNWAFAKNKNCQLYNYALGLEHKMIEMVLPKKDGFMRTGLAHIPSDENEKNESLTFPVEMTRGSSLLSSLSRIDYIKCDIEGYEDIVIPEIKEIIAHHKPVLQIETWGPHKIKVLEVMQELGYELYDIAKGKLIKDILDESESCEYIFIHKDSAAEIMQKLKAKGKA